MWGILITFVLALLSLSPSGGVAKVKYWPEASYLLLNQRVVGNLGSQGNYLGAM